MGVQNIEIYLLSLNVTTPFAADLFPVAKGALFVQIKLGFGLGLAMLVLGLGLVVTVAYRPLV